VVTQLADGARAQSLPNTGVTSGHWAQAGVESIGGGTRRAALPAGPFPAGAAPGRLRHTKPSAKGQASGFGLLGDKPNSAP